jgi:hypothetical protein
MTVVVVGVLGQHRLQLPASKISIRSSTSRRTVPTHTPAALGDREELRDRLGWRPEYRVVVVTVGGSGVGLALLRRVVASFPEAARRVDGLRMVAVAGPRIDPGSLQAPAGVEVLGHVPDLSVPPPGRLRPSAVAGKVGPVGVVSPACGADASDLGDGHTRLRQVVARANVADQRLPERPVVSPRSWF